MSNDDFGSMAIEQSAKKNFGVNLEVSQVVCDQIAVSPRATASVLLTRKKHLYVLIHAQGKQTYGEVRKIIRRMGLVAESYAPPKGYPTYFDEVARQQFVKVFPGRRPAGDEDLQYYRTLVAYNPALVRISQVMDGNIYCYDRDSASNWRPCAKLAYRRIATS